MRFRRVLSPLVRLCQYSGLCPISVYGSETNSVLSNKRKCFATLTAVICVHAFGRFHRLVFVENACLHQFFCIVHTIWACSRWRSTGPIVLEALDSVGTSGEIRRNRRNKNFQISSENYLMDVRTANNATSTTRTYSIICIPDFTNLR